MSKPNQQEKSLINLLRRTKEILDKHNIEFWLDCGTLLGAVREDKFLSWEHDIDLGVWDNKFSRETRILISKELFSKGFKVWMDENHMNIKKEPDFWLDINFYRLTDNCAVYPALCPKNLIGKILCILLPLLLSPYHPRSTNSLRSPTKRFIMKILISTSRAMPSFLRKKITYIISLLYKEIGSKNVSWVIPCNYFKNLSTIKFYEMDIRMPNDVEKYLFYRYGKDWRIPRKDWATERNDGAVVKSLYKPLNN